MKLSDKNFALNQPGTVKIIPEEPDDLWAVYNLIANGDIVTADTTRKVHLESTKNTASRVKLTIPVKVTCRDFDKDSSTVRVQGRNIEANQYVAAGSFHTLTLERNKGFELSKKIWDSTAVAALSETSERSSGADLAVVLIQEGQAEVYLVGNGSTTLCSKIESSKTRKKSASNVFFQDIFNAFVKHVDFNSIKSVMIASSGSTKDEFRRFLLSEAKRLKMKTIEDNKSRIVVAECKGDLKEVLNDNEVMNMIKDSKVVLEIRAFRELWDLLDSNSGRACYGPKNVEAAQEMMAIETLLITDDLYRSSDIKTRHKYMNLAKSVRKGGGKVLVYSAMHVSAQELAQLTGVAAIIRDCDHSGVEEATAPTTMRIPTMLLPSFSVSASHLSLPHVYSRISAALANSARPTFFESSAVNVPKVLQCRGNPSNIEIMSWTLNPAWGRLSC